MEIQQFRRALALWDLLNTIQGVADRCENDRDNILARARGENVRTSLFKPSIFQAKALNCSLYLPHEYKREANSVSKLAMGFKKQRVGFAMVQPHDGV